MPYQRIAPLAVIPPNAFDDAIDAEGCILLHGLINPARDVGHERGALFGLRQSAHQNHQDERARRGDTPAGIPSLNFWRAKISAICREESESTACPLAMASRRISKPRAVVVLFIPFS